MAEIHCSACDAIVQPGSQFCPKCGLQLMAQANQAVYVEKARFPLWGIVLVCVVAFMIGANILSRYNDTKAVSAREDFVTAVSSGALNTPAAFEARCGMPSWIKSTPRGQELHYFTRGQDTFVTFTTSGPIIESEHPFRVEIDPAIAFHHLDCKK